MRAALVAALALALGCGRATQHFPDSGHPDGGSDAGPDGGDGGCAGGFNGFARDGCFGNNSSRTVAVIADGCAATVYLDTIPSCTGRLFGAHDTFVGTCEGQSCSAASIPGTLTCTSDAGLSCT